MAHSGDKFKITKQINGEAQNIDNFIVVKNDSDLEITFSNGETFTLESFYTYNDAEIEFTVSDNSVYTLSSSSEFGFDLADGSTLVYAQGNQATLMNMTYGNSSLSAAIGEQISIANADRFADASTVAATEMATTATGVTAAGAGMSTAVMIGLGAVVVGGAVVVAT
jgi:hypothetical protein